MRVLVTGGSGMLGRELTKAYAKTDEVIRVSKRGNNQTRVCDLSDACQVAKLFDSEPIKLVIHTAAYSDVDGCEREPKLAYESNALATKFLAQNCGQKRIPLIYVSTDYVFDGRKTTPYKETDTTCPINVYGMTKLEGEYHTRRYASVSAVVRTSWLFGPGNPSNFVNAITERLRKEKVVRVLADQEDSPTYTKDLSVALKKIGEYLVSQVHKGSEKSHHDIFQVCNRGRTTRYLMTLKIKEWLELKDVEVQRLDNMPIENRPALRPAFAVMSTLHYETFFETKLRPWEDSLKEYIDGMD